MESAHPKTSDYTGRAESYAAGRSEYPPEVIDFILEHCGLKAGDLLIDIGSGTGISSRAFSRRGLKVIGIEPSADMRRQAQLANDQLKESNEELPVYKEGSGDKFDTPDHCADAVLAAQSFHWCDPEKALPEFARVLKPGGWVVLLWNPLDQSDQFTRDYADLMRKYCHGLMDNELMHLTAGVPLLKHNLFVEQNKFVFVKKQMMSEEDLCRRSLSDLYAHTDSQAREEWLKQLNSLHNKFQENGSIVLQSLIELYVARHH